MNTISPVRGPFAVETSEPRYPGDSTYHGIVDDTGAEVGRVHVGDDNEAAKHMAETFAASPELLEALRMMHRAFRDIRMDNNRPDRIDAVMTAELELRKLRAL